MTEFTFSDYQMMLLAAVAGIAFKASGARISVVLVLLLSADMVQSAYLERPLYVGMESVQPWVLTVAVMAIVEFVVFAVLGPKTAPQFLGQLLAWLAMLLFLIPVRASRLISSLFRVAMKLGRSSR